ncbi:MAG TPA: hypothetical protein ENL38_00535 [Candidatus Aminicenantes bacterium]|nr:hypothetical protein [Candidatus Aminicenantes bacterium]
MLVEINVASLYKGKAKLNQLHEYLEKVSALAGEGNEIVLYGEGPIWLYLKIAHFLHGKAKKLIYRSPVVNNLVIFDHDPY